MRPKGITDRGESDARLDGEESVATRSVPGAYPIVTVGLCSRKSDQKVPIMGRKDLRLSRLSRKNRKFYVAGTSSDDSEFGIINLALLNRADTR